MRITMLCVALLAVTGCGAGAKPAVTAVAMTSKTWSIWVHDIADQNIVTVNAQLIAGACTSVVGPTCFTGAELTNTSDDATPTPETLEIGVPVNPVPIVNVDGYAFNFTYAYQTAGAGTVLTGTGQFYPNGNVAGTWQCSGACLATAGDFTASQP